LLIKIKSLLPWYLKIVIKILLARLPVGYRLWQWLGLFRHGSMDTSKYALKVFETHVQRAGLTYSDLLGKKVLEIGPGDSIATALIAYAYGASAILIDSGHWARDELNPYLDLVKIMADNGLHVPDISNAQSIDDILKACNGQYITSGLLGWPNIKNESIDFIFSHAVLEHVRKSDFLDTIRECWRVLKKNSVATHQIDLRDHLSGALNNLRFDERIWESNFFALSGFYTNRIQMSAMIDLFKKANFKVEIICVDRWNSLPTPKHKIAECFSKLPDEELCIYSFSVRLVK
jgi:SAM-dependent methyltransferase